MINNNLSYGTYEYIWMLFVFGLSCIMQCESMSNRIVVRETESKRERGRSSPRSLSCTYRCSRTRCTNCTQSYSTKRSCSTRPRWPVAPHNSLSRSRGCCSCSWSCRRARTPARRPLGRPLIRRGSRSWARGTSRRGRAGRAGARTRRSAWTLCRGW